MRRGEREGEREFDVCICALILDVCIFKQIIRVWNPKGLNCEHTSEKNKKNKPKQQINEPNPMNESGIEWKRYIEMPAVSCECLYLNTLMLLRKKSASEWKLANKKKS